MGKMKYHDNDVYIVPNGFSLFEDGNNSYGSFVIDDYSVTSGQDPDDHIWEGKVIPIDENGKLTFSLGRKGSSGVADWWTSKVRKECNTFNEDPDDLNFAFEGTLTLNVDSALLGGRKTLVFKNICMAQGNAAGRNNWWFGGSKMCYFHNIYETPFSTNSAVVCYGMFTDGTRMVRTLVDRSELGASVNTYTFELKKVTNCQNATWMEKLMASKADKLSIMNLVMPGSHDAGMSEVHHLDIVEKFYYGAVLTQKNSLFEQLLCGCRYFDIRVDYDHDELVTYHREGHFGANGQSISDVFHQAKEFLDVYKNETVVFKISHIRSDCGHDKEKTVDKFVEYVTSNFSTLLYRSSEDVNLHTSDLKMFQGKVIMVCDFYSGYNGYDHTRGIFKYYDADESLSSPGFNQMNVYDKYSNTMIFDQMKSDQMEKWDHNAGHGAEKLFLLSWTLTINPGEILDNPTLSNESLANEANSCLAQGLEEGKDNRYAKPNIVYIDYIEDDLCDIIIKYNY